MTPDFKNLDAFKLDEDANIQVTFSMGSSSALKVWSIAEANGGISSNWRVLCQNTGFEREESLDFWADFQRHTGIAVTMLERRAKGSFEIVGHNSLSRAGEPFIELTSEHILRRDGTVGPRPLPSDGPRRLCSGELKTKTAHRYLRSLGWGRYFTTLGFRADEKGRADRRRKLDARRATGIVEGGIGLFPLYDAGITADDVRMFWRGSVFEETLFSPPARSVPIDWHLKLESHQSNCRFCHMLAEWKLKERIAEAPAALDPWIAMESVDRGVNAITGEVRNRFFRPGRKTMAELREEVLRGDMSVDLKALAARPECGTCHD